MKANEAPKKIYIFENPILDFTKLSVRQNDTDIEYVRTDAFIEKACGWIRENITNNPNANSVLVRNGCVTLGMLVEDFKKYMKGERILAGSEYAPTRTAGTTTDEGIRGTIGG